MRLAQPAPAMNSGGRLRRPRLPMKFWPATRWLIIANVAVFVLNLLLGGRVFEWCLFSGNQGVLHVQLWRWVSFQFMHASPIQLLFNMLFLYFFGEMMEPRLGRVRLVAFYLLCGVSAAAAYVLFWRLRVLVNSPHVPLAGASASILGLAVAGAVVDPYFPIRLFFPPMTLTLRTMVLIYLGLLILLIWMNREHAGAEAAQFGGAIAGYLLIRNPAWLSRMPFVRRRRRFWKPGDPAENFFRRESR